ncbi:MAG: cardiolipin synthase [Cellulosilyticaceae bacterium]
MFWLIFSLNVLCASYVIFIERKNYVAAWAWILTILFVPILGFILYLYVGRRLHIRRSFDRKEEDDRFMNLLHRQMFSFHYKQDEFESLPTQSYNPLITLHLTGHEVPYSTHNNATLITDGHKLFDDLFESIKQARHSIHLEYYIIRYDSLGQTLQQLLIQKASEGLEVLLVYDSVGCHKIPRQYFKELQSAGVKLGCFFKSPLSLLNLHFNYRNHRKICVIDGKIGYLGGFNIGNEYMGLDPKMGYWRDTHLKLTGNSIVFLDLQFLLDWRFSTRQKLSLEKYISAYTNLTLSNSPRPLGLQLVASGPDSKYPAIRNGYIKMITEAKTSIRIQTPYFIPDESLLTALKLAALSGVSVEIMIPNKPDHMFVYWATYANIGDLLSYGAKCYTYDSGFLHAKTIVIDECLASVGTANFDVRSLSLNFEINAFIYDPKFSMALVTAFNEDLEHCTEITLSHYQSRSLLIKIKESIARLFSPIL